MSLNQNVWRDHVTMQQDVLLHFWVIFLHWNQVEIWKKIFCCPALELFHCCPLWKQCCLSALKLFHCLPLWTAVRLHGKKVQNATKQISYITKVPLTFREKIKSLSSTFFKNDIIDVMLFLEEVQIKDDQDKSRFFTRFI